MTKPKPPPKPPGRYGRLAILERVEHARIALGWEIKAVADRTLEAKTPEDLWYKRTGKRGTPFTVQELGRIADVFGAPFLWPFEDWAKLEALYGRKWPGTKGPP